MLLQRALLAQRAMVTTRQRARAAAESVRQAATSGGSWTAKEGVFPGEHNTSPLQQRFEGVRNIRDLAEALPGMRPGCVFRTAAPQDATPGDVKLLFNDLGIKDLIDLRSSEEVRLECSSPAFAGTSFCRYRRDPAVDRVVPDASTYAHGDEGRADVLRVQIAVMEKNRYYWSLLSRMRKRQALQLMATALVDKPASRRMAIQEVNKGGLEGLYQVLLEDSAKEFVAALRHIRKSAEASRPVLFFCKAGKDRTGLLAALLLSVLGASEAQVLADYVKSDAYHQVALAGLEDNPKVTGLDRQKFERAPREAMHSALQLLREQYGGVAAYLERAGLGRDEQAELRELLLQPDALASPAATAAPAGPKL